MSHFGITIKIHFGGGEVGTNIFSTDTERRSCDEEERDKYESLPGWEEISLQGNLNFSL